MYGTIAGLILVFAGINYMHKLIYGESLFKAIYRDLKDKRNG